ncbi:MAG: MerR family transcriptional regulator [Puia sp.]|nr:MerR family transcriptional regulator [Puia sp.]
MKTLPQIAFDFAADKDARQQEPGQEPLPVQPLQDEQKAGVGVRLKHTRKETDPVAEQTSAAAHISAFGQTPETAQIPATEEIPGTGEAIEEAPARGEIIVPEEAVIAVAGETVIEATFLEISSSSGKTKSTRGRKSLKQVAAEADLIEIPGDDELFSKQYYGMGEVATMFRVNQSLLRFWEAEFDILKPRKNKKGDRYFRPVDIKNLHLIYNLLRQRKYTIEGAREFLKNSKKADARFEAIRRLQEIRAFMLELKAQI